MTFSFDDPTWLVYKGIRANSFGVDEYQIF